MGAQDGATSTEFSVAGLTDKLNSTMDRLQTALAKMGGADAPSQQFGDPAAGRLLSANVVTRVRAPALTSRAFVTAAAIGRWWYQERNRRGAAPRVAAMSSAQLGHCTDDGGESRCCGPCAQRAATGVDAGEGRQVRARGRS